MVVNTEGRPSAQRPARHRSPSRPFGDRLQKPGHRHYPIQRQGRLNEATDEVCRSPGGAAGLPRAGHVRNWRKRRAAGPLPAIGVVRLPHQVGCAGLATNRHGCAPTGPVVVAVVHTRVTLRAQLDRSVALGLFPSDQRQIRIVWRHLRKQQMGVLQKVAMQAP